MGSEDPAAGGSGVDSFGAGPVGFGERELVGSAVGDVDEAAIGGGSIEKEEPWEMTGEAAGDGFGGGPPLEADGAEEDEVGD